MEKLKYYKLGLIDPDLILSIWEYPRILPIQNPTIFTYSPNKPTLKVMQKEDSLSMVDWENLPPEIKLLKIKGEIETAFMVDENLMGFQFHYPLLKKYTDTGQKIREIICEVLGKYNLPLEIKGNDILIQDGLGKKFFGMTGKNNVDGWRVILFSLTMKFNYDLANQVYKLNDDKFTKKGAVKDMRDIVVGLDEIVPGINREELIDEIVRAIAENYSLLLEGNELSDEEQLKMISYKP